MEVPSTAAKAFRPALLNQILHGRETYERARLPSVEKMRFLSAVKQRRLLPLVCAAFGFMQISTAFAEEPAGDWGGLLFGSIHAVFHIRKLADGRYDATTESPDQSDEVFRVASVEATPDHLKLTMTDVGAVYEGTWDADNKVWSGFITQGRKTPLLLTRLDPASLAALRPKRPQDAAAKIALTKRHNEEVSIPNPGASGVVLVGTLTKPIGIGPFPLAILLAGSGPQTRDEEVGRHKIFLVLADELSRRGIAVLRYDKRGVGASKGSYGSATTADFASDADAVVRSVVSRPDIDQRHIGLIGHSEGGAIAPMVAAGNPAVSFLVLMAGPGLRGSEMRLRQQALIAKADGVSPQAIADQTSRSRAIFGAVTSSIDMADAKRRILAIADQPISSSGPSESEIYTTPWMYYFLRHDPVPVLKAVHAPVLAVAGGLDLQVPSTEDLAIIKDALAEDKDVTIVEIPGLNHLFQTARTGSPSEYATIEQTMSPVAMRTISDWVAAHTRYPAGPLHPGPGRLLNFRDHERAPRPLDVGLRL